MTDTYLHGIKTIEKNEINMTITDADVSSVVIIGTSPTVSSVVYPKITNYTEMKQHVGENLDGFTLAEAVETVLKESDGANIYTINIFNSAVHTTEITDEALTFTDGVAKLAHIFYDNLTVKKGNSILTLNSDYVFEKNRIKVLATGEIAKNQTNIKASYTSFDPEKVTDAHVIGSTSASNVRSGAQQIYDIIAEYAVIPGIIIAPGYTSKNVRNALELIADELRAEVFFDVPKGTTVPQAETARINASGKIDLTGINENAVIAMPWVKRYNSYLDTETIKPLSPVLAGIRVRQDRERNVAKSIDNTVSKTITRTEFPISFILNKVNTDANRLNALGITTVIKKDGKYRVWGGRNMSFPSKNGIMTFEAPKRTRNFIQKSIENSSFSCIGENITQGFIDDVTNAINSAFAKWSNPVDIKNHIIYDGEAYYDPSLNSVEGLANGKIKFSYKHCPLAVSEEINFEDTVDINIITKTLS